VQADKHALVPCKCTRRKGGDPIVGYFVEYDSPSAVPESSTWAMMLLGFLGLGLVAYRRKGKALSLA
jgi:hypothetical protein